MVLLTELCAKETPQDFIIRYKKYNTVCQRLGYEKRSCKERKQGIIAFHARLSSTLHNLGSNAVVVFGKVTLNSGSTYNGNKGIFTAPTDGIYSFTWTILTAAGSHFHSEIVVNGNVVGYNNANGISVSRQYESSSSTAVIRMKKNDKVWIRTHGNHGREAQGDWSSFSGFQL
ncbi:heavy metal-binding protein HIP-like [Ostrea edulis]|uniref:heavy metal-binding protein HIP-like n=1 Tax=Ostrea edulis TaxID=37623 RepID=UPI0024AF7FC5|nr:heavy metal-binding protein HIP-like [Ostrea edulis]